jgi:hypothetical protein
MSVSPRRELSIWADFNSLDANQRVTASLRFADSPARPSEGERVRLHDDEGNAVMGVVEEIHDVTVHVRPEMETWITANLTLDTPFAHPTAFRAGPVQPRVVMDPAIDTPRTQ